MEKSLNINLEAIKSKMIENGYTDSDENINWSETLLDALEELYELETKLKKTFKVI